MLRCWQLLSAVLSTAKDIPVSNHSRRKCALIRGSRRYLERGHDSYMQAIIQQNRSEVLSFYHFLIYPPAISSTGVYWWACPGALFLVN